MNASFILKTIRQYVLTNIVHIVDVRCQLKQNACLVRVLQRNGNQ
jgi:hypothetical protein